ncbi:MAG TPA: M1 family metallopeptidase, partial [Parvularculaceae bacterium]|nr:M1 family metallopeptidase [Parvularculaceae bacterium]
LVTMAWWDDLWLNEGFAEWMQSKATDQFHPEWKLWFDAMDQKQAAMGVDSRQGTHPIIQSIKDVFQANEAFDAITYLKGQAVIWMLEDFVGADNFRSGVQAYIKAHAYAPAVTDDLWRALSKTSPAPIANVAHDFTLQPGAPLIRVEKTKSGIRLTEGQFVADDSAEPAARWRVPVIARAVVGEKEWRGVVVPNKPTDIPLDAGATAIVNAGQAGYYRTLYAPDLFEALSSKFAALASIDQLGLIDDARSLGLAGYAPLSNFLALTSRATPDMAPQVLAGVADALAGMARSYQGLPGEPAFDSFGRAVLDPILARVGWEAAANEDSNVTLLRGDLLDTLSALNDQSVIDEADRRFAAYLTDPSALSSDLRSMVLGIVAEHATPKNWDALHALARKADTSLERNRLYRLLGETRDEALAKRALAITLTDEAPVTTRPSIIDAVSEFHPELAFDFAVAHLDQVNAWLEPDSRTEFEAGLAGNANDPAMIDKLKAFAEAHIPPTGRQAAVRAEGEIAYAAKIRAERLPEVDQWLAAHPAP